jgi:hypothetical protein
MVDGAPARQHGPMEKPLKPRAKPRAASDFLGAFCFVVLVATVAYAALTAP